MAKANGGPGPGAHEEYHGATFTPLNGTAATLAKATTNGDEVETGKVSQHICAPPHTFPYLLRYSLYLPSTCEDVIFCTADDPLESLCAHSLTYLIFFSLRVAAMSFCAPAYHAFVSSHLRFTNFKNASAPYLCPYQRVASLKSLPATPRTLFPSRVEICQTREHVSGHLNLLVPHLLKSHRHLPHQHHSIFKAPRLINQGEPGHQRGHHQASTKDTKEAWCCRFGQ